jgi:ABC-type dipeptide/oligopeptide/nickel transport system permease subunit
MRTTDALLSFPYLLLVILVVAMIGPSFENSIISIAIWSIPNYVRLVRSTTLTIKEREFIQAAKVTGESSLAIMFYHILPGCVSVIVVQSTIFLGRAIEIMAALSFLGLGTQPPMPEWGAMVGLGRLYIQSAPYVVVFPALAIFVAILGFNALGDALRDALDPRLRGVL